MKTLSFGTVIDVLHQYMADKIKKTAFTMAIIDIAIPNNSHYEYSKHSKSSTLTSELNSIYHCKTNIEAMFTNGQPLPCLQPTETLIEQFDKKVIPLMKESKYKPAILALCDMIEKDCSLNAENGENVPKFEKYIGKNIREFLNDNEYVLSEFLAKICLYTINEVNNTAGREWVESLNKNSTAIHEESGGRTGDRKNYSNGFKCYATHFENSEREIQVWGTSSEKEKAQNTASIISDGKTAQLLSEDDTLGGESYEHYRKRTNTEIVRDIGSENQICLCCKHWDGDMENAFKSSLGSIGKCILKDEKALSTNAMCKWAIPSLERANKYRRTI